MRKTSVFCALVLLVGCQPSTDQKVATTTFEERTEPSVAKEDETQPLLMVIQRTHPFSTPGQQDYFRLNVRGTSITEGTVYFTITTLDGQVIHEESFPTAYLEASMVYEMENAEATEKQREAYIVKRIEDFVQAEDFITPAIAANSTPDTSFISRTSWTKIQDRENAIGFKYLLGKEDGHLLVYDPEKKKAVRYGSFGG